MFNPKNAQVGDQLFYEPKGGDWLGVAIGFFSDIFHPSRIKVSHVSTISQIDNNGSINIIEAHITSGVVEKTLNPKWYPNIIHGRYKYGISKMQKKILIQGMRNDVVGRSYDALSFPSKFLRSIILPKETPLLNDKGAFDCAECVDWSFLKFLKILLTPKINVHTASPMSILYGGEIKTIS